MKNFFAKIFFSLFIFISARPIFSCGEAFFAEGAIAHLSQIKTITLNKIFDCVPDNNATISAIEKYLEHYSINYLILEAIDRRNIFILKVLLKNYKKSIDPFMEKNPILGYKIACIFALEN